MLSFYTSEECLTHPLYNTLPPVCFQGHVQFLIPITKKGVTHLSHNTLPQCMFIQGHVHLFTQVAQGAVEVSRPSEVDQSTSVFLIWHHDDVQSSVLPDNEEDL